MQMKAVSTPATEASSAAFLGPQIGYLVHYKRNVEELSKKVTDLSSMETDIKQKVNAAKRRGEMIYQVVERWISKVEKIINEASELSEEASGINSCFSRWCCGRRYTVGKKAKKSIDLITGLLDEGKNLGELSIPSRIQDIDLIPPEDFEAFEVTKVAMDLVMKALMHDEIKMIGVHGMGGIGKTTLMKKIGNQVRMSGFFEVVVMVSVSQNHDLKRIQDEIAEDLCFRFDQERGEEARARRLLARLKQERSVLIILDDMWTELELSKVGIPWGEHHRGCKIVLTTRREYVCKAMKAQAKVRLECLSEPDSWHLFRKNAGTDVDSPNLNEVARDVAKECKGLPVALVTLGRAMQDSDRGVWETVLQQLRESDFTFIEGMDVKVFKSIKLSYDFLSCDDTKSIFLYCCLFPEEHKIGMDELLQYIVGEGLLKDFNPKQARRRLNLVIHHLISSNLLQKADKEGYVWMHDVVRDVAIMIASKDHGYVVKAGRRLEPWPEKELLQKCKRLSLMGNELSNLPEKPEIPNIITLTLSRCQSLEKIPDNFFERMESLVNLDLSHTPILSLPASLSCLENLRSLCLDGCTALEDISLIVRLRKLEMISLKKTPITTLLVREIREFSNLKLLAMEENAVEDSVEESIVQSESIVQGESIVQQLSESIVQRKSIVQQLKEPIVHRESIVQSDEPDFAYIEEMDLRVFSEVKLSYDYIVFDDTQSLFLYCCIFPEDHKIGMDELLQYIIGEGLLKDVNLKQAKRKLNQVIDHLTSSHLLQKADREGYVLMHDVIRDVVIIIASKDHGYVIKAGRGLEPWPEKELLQKCKRLSRKEKKSVCFLFI